MDLVQGNPTEVKVVLASVATALAIYQVVLAAIGYRKLRVIEAEPAFMTHRASGDTIAVLLVVVAVMCLSYFELEDGAFHAATGFLLLVVLAVKVVVIRWWHAAERQEQQEDSGEGS
jgi:L-asparagine transporter-like permease